MTARDPAAVVAANAGALKREETKREAGERLLGRDAATLLAPDVKNASGDPAATAEALFRAGQKAAGDLSGTVSRAAFVRTLIEKAKIAESDLFPVLASGEPVRVIYARAGAADRAYRLISALFSDLRVGYAETNQDAAEGVESGDADLLLLPYADAAGNPVLSTEALSETYGLYLAALARVKVGDGLVYGLFGRAVLPVVSGSVTVHLSTPDPDAGTLAGVFGFARLTGLVPDGATFPSNGRRASFAFSGDREGCLAAAVYCLAFCPGCELRGWRTAHPLSER